MAQNLKKITLPIIDAQGTVKPTEYDIPENFGKSQLISGSTETLLEGIDSNSFISLYISANGKNYTSALLKFTGTQLVLLSNSNAINVNLSISNGILTATPACTGNIFYAGKIINKTNTTTSNAVSLNCIVQNGITTGIDKPDPTTPGQVYIQIG